MNAITPQFEPYITFEYAEKVKEQILSGWVGCGTKTTEFENRFAEYVKTKYAIATTSGTVALLVAIDALDIQQDDLIVLPNYSFVAATNVLRYKNYNFRLHDISRETLSLDIESLISKNNSEGCKYIIFINHNGYVGEDLIKLVNFCKYHSIILIEDSACAIGQWYKEKHAGTFGKVGCFSFSVPKIITTGQGGMIVTDDKCLAKRCREIIDQGSLSWRQTGFYKNVGINFKFNDILASFGLAQLSIIDTLLEKRYLIQKRFLDNGLNLQQFQTDNLSGTWMNILIDVDASTLMSKLNKNNIQSKMYYRPIHASIGLKYSSKDYPNSTYAFRRTLYLPSSLTLTNLQIDNICRCIE